MFVKYFDVEHYVFNDVVVRWRKHCINAMHQVVGGAKGWNPSIIIRNSRPWWPQLYGVVGKSMRSMCNSETRASAVLSSLSRFISVSIVVAIKWYVSSSHNIFKWPFKKCEGEWKQQQQPIHLPFAAHCTHSTSILIWTHIFIWLFIC